MTKIASFQRPQLIREGVYEHLRKEILQGNLQVGEWLRERELSENLDVSRTPIREALKQLVQEGLLESSTKGIRVREYSLEEAVDIYEVREMLEAKAVRLVAERSPKDGIMLLEKQLERSANIPFEDFAGHIQADLDFHSLIAELSGNQALQDVIDSLTGRLINLRVLTKNEIRDEESQHQHEAIVKAITAKDADKAEAEMHKHIGHFKNILKAKIS